MPRVILIYFVVPNICICFNRIDEKVKMEKENYSMTIQKPKAISKYPTHWTFLGVSILIILHYSFHCALSQFTEILLICDANKN